MKKLLCIFISAIMIVSCMTACSAKPAFEVLVVGGCECISGTDYGWDISLSNTVIAMPLLDDNRKIVCNGVEYDCSYKTTAIGYLYKNTLDYYTYENGRSSVNIALNRDTKRVDSYSIRTDDLYSISPKLSRDECLLVAQQYLGTYIQDADQYEVVDEEDNGAYGGTYRFEFARIIDGVETSDSARIDVTGHGTVYSHYFSCLGEMRGAELPTSAEMDEIQASIDAKLAEMYASRKDEYSLSYDLHEMLFMRMKNGSYALKYTFWIGLTPKSAEQSYMPAVAHLLVVLN